MSCAVPRYQSRRTRQQARYLQRAGTICCELDVVDLAHGQPVLVHHLAVEEVKRGVEGAFEPAHHAPIRVTTSSGIAARAAIPISPR